MLPISDIYLMDENTLIVTRTSEQVLKKDNIGKERVHIKTWTLRITKTVNKIVGTMIGPSRGGTGEQISHFAGKRMPPVGPAPELSTIKYGKSIKLFNGKKIIDNQVVDGPTGGAISSDVFAHGPIYLQGDHGNVTYRNIVLTPVL